MKTSGNIVTLGHFTLDLQYKTLKDARGHEQKLNWKTFSVLKLLIESSGTLVTREELISKVWEGNFPVGDKALATAIWNLRKSFADSDVVIETIPKKGFVLSTVSTSTLSNADIESKTLKENNKDTKSNKESHVKNSIKESIKNTKIEPKIALANNKIVFSLVILLLIVIASFSIVPKSDLKEKEVALLIRTKSTTPSITAFTQQLSTSIAAIKSTKLLDTKAKAPLLASRDHIKYAEKNNLSALVYLDLIELNDVEVDVSVQIHLISEQQFFMHSWQVNESELSQLIPLVSAYLDNNDWQ